MTHSPEKDTALTKNYGKASLKSKLSNKIALQKELHLKEGKDIFVLGITCSISEKENGDELIELLKALLEVETQIIICANAEKKYEKIFTLFSKDYKGLFTVVEYSDENRRRVHAASDTGFFLSLNKESHIVLEEAMNYGVVPISIYNEGLENFSAIEEKGNAFLIEKTALWNMFEACIRAKENFKFPYDWKNLQMACMSK